MEIYFNFFLPHRVPDWLYGPGYPSKSATPAGRPQENGRLNECIALKVKKLHPEETEIIGRFWLLFFLPFPSSVWIAHPGKQGLPYRRIFKCKQSQKEHQPNRIKSCGGKMISFVQIGTRQIPRSRACASVCVFLLIFHPCLPVNSQANTVASIS